MVVLEDQFKSLGLSNEPKRQGTGEFSLRFNEEKVFEILESYSMETKDALGALNKLIMIQRTVDPVVDTSKDIDGEIRSLVDQVTPFIKTLDLDTLSKVESEDVIGFLEVISLMIANFTVNDFIKTEIDSSLIDKMLTIYLSVLEILRFGKFKGHSYLLTRTSLISPLLITISFSFKLKSTESPTLIKVLASLFTLLMTRQSLFDPVVKLFAMNSTTNIEMFQVFNKLWERTLEIPADSQLDTKQSPGPTSIINRINALSNYELSSGIINQVFPFIPSQYLYQLSQSSLKAHTVLSNLKSGKEVTSNITDLLGFVIDDLNTEVLLTMIDTLDVTDLLLQYFEEEQYKSQLGYVFAKISQSSNFNIHGSVSRKLIPKILTRDVLFELESSENERYKVLFELLDHNPKIDFHSDFSMVFAIEAALSLIDRDFDLQKDFSILSNLGSSVNLPALFVYSGFLLSNALLKFANPTKSLPHFLDEIMQLKRFPPLPKSEFFDFSHIFLSKSQQNLKNPRIVTNALFHCLSILHKIVTGFCEVKDWVHPIQNVNDTDNDLEYQATDKFLFLNYSAFFGVLHTVNELLQKSTGYYNNDHFSAIFYDLSSIGNTLKLQTFQLFEDLFQFYDTFAFYKLVKFIMKVSMTDLELQKFSIKILNHLVFHSNNGIKDSIKDNDLILKLLEQYVTLWNDGSTEYKQFENFLGLEQTSSEKAIFDTISHLKFLGFSDVGIASLSPATSSSGSSIHNYSYTNNSNNFSGLQTNVSTPNNSFSFISTSGGKQQPLDSASGYFNINSNMLNNNNQIGFSGSNTPVSAGVMDYTTYRTSNIRNVQSFIPQQQQQHHQQQYNNGLNNNRAQSVHVDQFGK